MLMVRAVSLAQLPRVHKVMVQRVQISVEQFHMDWIEEQREENDDFNFSAWVRKQIEEEANDAPIGI